MHEALVETEGRRKAASVCLQAYLTYKAEIKSRFYSAATPSAFVPLVFSLDGAEQAQVTTCFKRWAALLPSMRYVMSIMSVALVRTRAETFCLD